MKRSLPFLLALAACASGPQTQPTAPEPSQPPAAQSAPAGQGQAASSAAQASSAQAEAPEAPAQAPATGDLPFRPLETPPPLDTVTLPVPKDPIVNFRVVFHSGAIDDPKGKEGLTALAAQLMAEGGTKSLSAADLIDALYPMAGEVQVSTDEEFTVFEGRVHKDYLDKFLPLFSDVLTAPRLDPKEFERLRTDALNTLKTQLRGEDDETLGKVALKAELYPAHPYRHFIGGTVEGLSAITLDDVRAQIARVFSQDRVVIGLGGAVDDALVAKVKQSLQALPAKGAAPVVLPAVKPHGGAVHILEKESLSTAISLGEPIDVRRGDPDFPALALAMSYLGEHRQFSGRLMNELRVSRGLNYGDYAYPEAFVQAGGSTFPETNVGRAEQMFSIWIRPVEPQNAVFATRAALYFFDDLLQHGIPKERFDLIRNFVTGYTKLWELTDQRRLGYAIDDRFYGTKDYLASYRAAIAELTPEQVQAAVRRHLSMDRLDFAYVTQDGQKLASQLTSGAPSPISYPSPKPPEVLEADKQIVGFPLPVDAKRVKISPADQFMQR